MPRTEDGGFLLDDSELDPYKTEEASSGKGTLNKPHDPESYKDK